MCLWQSFLPVWLILAESRRHSAANDMSVGFVLYQPRGLPVKPEYVLRKSDYCIVTEFIEMIRKALNKRGRGVKRVGRISGLKLQDPLIPSQRDSAT